MELERKLELMKRYDFSRFPKDGPENLHGFGAAILGGIRNSANMLSHYEMPEERAEEYQATLLAAYGYVRSQYDMIDFGELDESDMDFHTLFETNRLLPDLGRAIHHFLLEPSNEKYETIQNICGLIMDADTPPYRSIIERLEAQRE